MINIRLIYFSIILFAIISILLAFYPEVDIRFSRMFFSKENGFIYKNNPLILFFFNIIPLCTKAIISFYLIYLTYILLKSHSLKYIISSFVFYLILSNFIGPGLVVNNILKESFGRARPAQVKHFNGSKNFTSAFTLSNECSHNCSFTSGHTSMACYFTSLAYLRIPYRVRKENKTSIKRLLFIKKIYFTIVYITFIIFSLIVGFSRILMGGHFLSDVIASCFITLFINHLIFLCWQKMKFIIN